MDKRMSDAALNSLSYAVRGAVRVPLLSSYRELRAELDRARASELAALLARVAELEAAAAGETGTPKAEGEYRIEFMAKQWPGAQDNPLELRYGFAQWWGKETATGYDCEPGWHWQEYDGDFEPCGVTITRHWRLPGETYTEIPR